MAVEQPEKVDDIGAATEAAYAEKPYQDALVDYRENLSDEGKKALEYIASQEAEKALANYKSDQEESPDIRILRERALATLAIPASVDRKVERGFNGDMNPEWRNRCEYGVRELGSEMMERIIKDPDTETRYKMNHLRFLGSSLGRGVEIFSRGDVAEENKTQDTDVLWGDFIAAVMSKDRVGPTEVILDHISRIQGRPAGTIISENLELFERLRRSYPQEVGSNLDHRMEQSGWIWNDKNKKYIELSR